MPPPRLPPLNALRVFHAVARRLNFRSAAEELLVSPQAVSQQIKVLEEALGVALVERAGRGIKLTDEGVLFSQFVNAAFDEVLEGVRRVSKAAPRDRVNVNVSPYFATRYLLDRLGTFQERQPGVDVRLTTMLEMPDFSTDEIDVSIQWGYGEWARLDQTRLLDDPKIICCAPAVARKLRKPTDLAKVTLLQLAFSKSIWSDVLGHLGLGGASIRDGIQLHDAAMMRRATVAGTGVGLLSALDAAEDTRAGLVVAPFGFDALAGMPADQVPGFYLLVPRSRRRVKSVAAFCDWMTREDWTKSGAAGDAAQRAAAGAA
jgi:LysR family transcriptional regulator, glycine cleavage system transcriptional activator